MRISIKTFGLLGTAALALSACNKTGSMNGKVDADIKETAYSERVYWGDTHLHTSNSIDAFGFGVKLGPEEALRFARGEEVTATWGLKAKLERPLDFLVVADHSDQMGLFPDLVGGKPEDHEDCNRHHREDSVVHGIPPEVGQQFAGAE